MKVTEKALRITVQIVVSPNETPTLDQDFSSMPNFHLTTASGAGIVVMPNLQMEILRI